MYFFFAVILESRTRARKVDTTGTDYCYDNEKKCTFGLMRKENNLAERATNEHANSKFVTTTAKKEKTVNIVILHNEVTRRS